MFKLRILPALMLGLVLLQSVSCSDEQADQTMGALVEMPGNVELSFDLGVDEDEEMRRLMVEAGSDALSRRPLIKINAGDKINSYIYLAHVDATGKVTMLPQPFPVVLEAKTAKEPGRDNGVYAGLQVVKQSINIPNMANLRNNTWYVTGVIGGRLNSSGHLEFDPNQELINQNQDVVSTAEQRQPNIPYTFPWTKVTLTQNQVAGTTTDVISVKGVRFQPRGLFLRFDVQNNSDYGMYVMKNLSVPKQDDYAVAATLNATAPSSAELASGTKDFGFVRLGDALSNDYSFKHGDRVVDIITNPNGATSKITVKAYAHYISKTGITHPHIERPQPKSGRFWLWLADLKPTASTVKLSLVGEPLGRLRAKQNFTLTAMAIPSGKKGVSAARTLNIHKNRPYTPLEYVARGNVVRSGNSNTNEGFEVGPRMGYAGGAIYDSYNAGVNFRDTDVFDINNTQGVTIKPGFVQPNRFIPTVNDWRTVVPNFNEITGVAHEKQWEEEDYPNDGIVKEANSGDILGYARGWYNSNITEHKTFGSASYPQIPMGKRGEFTRFRAPEGGYKDQVTTARYFRIGYNTIVGYRYVRHTQANFAERRKYFCAYRLDFTPGPKGRMLAREVYIGEDVMTANGASNPAADEDAWFEVFKTEEFWTQRTAAGEVIARNFPREGFAGTGLYQDTFARYFTSNRDSGDGRYPLISYEFAEDGYRKMFTWNFLGGTGNNMQLRYFVVDPGKAYQEWLSRN